MAYPFELPDLGYPHDALEPHIDARTMEIHHGRHHAAYTANLNAALKGHPELHGKSANELVADLGALPEGIRMAVRNNGGGYVNHNLFWQLMAPGGADAPGGALAAAIDAAFGSFDDFKARFATAAITRFGSGWAWLTADGGGALEVVSTREPGHTRHGRQNSAPWLRRLGARLLPELPEPPSGLRGRLLERGQLDGGRREARGRLKRAGADGPRFRRITRTTEIEMQGTLTFGIVAFTQLLVVYNPLSAMPMFASLTAEDSRRERLRTALVGVATSVVVMVVFTFAGHAILDFFAITTEAFQIAAGVIFFGIGSDMLQARRSRVKTTRREQDEAASRDSLAIIPLGLPTLAGPGTIVTVIALAGLADGTAQLFSVYLASLLVGAVTLPCLVLAPALLNALGRTGLNVVTRIMGLLVMVVGVQFLINGIGIVVASWGAGG